MATSLSPHLPADLTELIVEELCDSSKDLSSCSLISLGWLPCARKRFLSARKIPAFLELVQSPLTTLFWTVRRLEIWISRDDPHSEVHLPILEMLPKFQRLRGLTMWCNFPVPLPALPDLAEPELSGVFASYASFVRFMSDLPALRSLTLDEVSWDDFSDPQLVFPPLELRTVTLDWGSLTPIPHVMLPLRPRMLILSFWPDPASEWLRCISSYLRHLGDHLQYLQLNCA
ncbi:hypothetical protein DFH06DRAFT_1216447 [Mycena polygramma]|nr:hypothetical protein DFH06DRAFT_1216447 [Mycena polygramma]